MVDTKLNTGSIRKKHLMENKQEKTKKIVEKVKQEQNADGPPAKKQKKPLEPKAENGKVTEEGERIKAKRIKRKKKAQKDVPVKNTERTEQRETKFQEEAEEYLDKWKNDRTNWRFSKNLQTWLICNMLNDDKVDSEHFDLLCEYLSLGQGTVRDNVTKCAITQSRLIRAKVDPKPEEAEENQEKLARCQRLIKLMTSKAKSAGDFKPKPKKEQAATEAASPVKATEEGEDVKKGKKKRKRGRADKLNLRKENKPAPSPVKAEEVGGVAKKKVKGAKVVSFEESEEAPPAKASVNGKGSPKKSKKTKGK